MSWLTAKVAQGIAAALLVLSIGLGLQVWVQSGRLASAKKDVQTAQAQRDTAITERDAWKGKADGAVAANAAYEAVLDAIKAEQAREAAAAAAAAQAAASRVAEAEAEKRRATTELAEFRRLFGARPADCDAALQALDRVCPLLRDY